MARIGRAGGAARGRASLFETVNHDAEDARPRAERLRADVRARSRQSCGGACAKVTTIASPPKDPQCSRRWAGCDADATLRRCRCDADAYKCGRMLTNAYTRGGGPSPRMFAVRKDARAVCADGARNAGFSGHGTGFSGHSGARKPGNAGECPGMPGNAGGFREAGPGLAPAWHSLAFLGFSPRKKARKSQ